MSDDRRLPDVRSGGPAFHNSTRMPAALSQPRFAVQRRETRRRIATESLCKRALLARGVKRFSFYHQAIRNAARSDCTP
jgi:hypothetical protein